MGEFEQRSECELEPHTGPCAGNGDVLAMLCGIALALLVFAITGGC